MTLTAAPWAIDGARTPAALARLATRAAVKESGIINPGDLKVLQLAVPGDGVRISAGGGAIENRYVSNSGQTYIVEATAEEILGADDNFSGIVGNGATQSHLICLTVGDPQYSTSGHPWFTEAMKTSLASDPEAAADFQYVRPWVIKNVPSTTQRVEDLSSPPTFPCYALARVDVPAGSGSITTAMIKDLRKVVNRREQMDQISVATPDADVLSVSAAYTYETWPDASSSSVYVPPWATAVYVTAFINGFKQASDATIDAPVRVAMRKSDNTFVTAIQQSVYYAESGAYLPKGTDKVVNMAGKMSIPAAQRGTTCKFSTEATLANTSMNNTITTTTRTNVGITLRFVEEAV
jgi:hypothetical protein